jgi:hypothetical protein
MWYVLSRSWKMFLEHEPADICINLCIHTRSLNMHMLTFLHTSAHMWIPQQLFEVPFHSVRLPCTVCSVPSEHLSCFQSIILITLFCVLRARCTIWADVGLLSAPLSSRTAGRIFMKLDTTALYEQLWCNLNVHVNQTCLMMTLPEDLRVFLRVSL